MTTLATPLEDFMVGPVRVVVRYGCVRRDQYEILTAAPFPRALKNRLAELGVVRGSPVLFTVDVPATHQLTVAPERGRMVIMPRLSVEREQQRQSALAVVQILVDLIAAEQTD